MDAMRLVSLSDFLTDKQIDEAVKLWLHHGNTKEFVDAVKRRIILPNMKVINHRLGQENDAAFLAYLVQYVFHVSSKRNDIRFGNG